MRGLAEPATLTDTVFSHPAASDAQAFRFPQSRHQTVTTETDESAIRWWEESETWNSSHIIELIWHRNCTELVGTVPYRDPHRMEVRHPASALARVLGVPTPRLLAARIIEDGLTVKFNTIPSTIQ